MSRLDGKVALVTGASRGIGRAIAIELASRGAHIIVNYFNNLTAAEEVVKQIKQNHNVNAYAIQANVSSFPEIQALYSQTIAKLGHLDIVVSNAGIEHFQSIEKVTPEEFDRVYNVNTRGQFFVAQQGYLHISEGGRIIMMSSISADLRGLADHAVYSSSKAAIEAMVRSLPSDFSPKRVTVNAVAPGGIESDMAAEHGWKYLPGGDPSMSLETVAQVLADGCPLKRFGKAEDVSRVVAFLASEEGGWINGMSLDAIRAIRVLTFLLADNLDRTNHHNFRRIRQVSHGLRKTHCLRALILLSMDCFRTRAQRRFRISSAN